MTWNHIPNVPNLLTIFRILAAFVFLYYGWMNRWEYAFPIFCLAALTDMVDGTIARLLGQRTRLGAFLDPMADKILMFFCFVTLTLHHFIPLYLTSIVILRDLMIVLGLAYLKQHHIQIIYRPTYLSKLTTFFQLLTILSALFVTQDKMRLAGYSYGQFFSDKMLFIVAVTAVLTIVTGFQYIRIGWRMLHEENKTHHQ